MSLALDLTNELRSLLGEKSGHWPYKNKNTLGPTGTPKHGPPPATTRSVKQTDDWHCKKTGKYVQLCKSGKKKKIVRIDPGYKAGYNSAYRAWKASKKAKAKKANK